MTEQTNPLKEYVSHALAAAHRETHISLTNRLKAFGVQVEAWRVMETLEKTPDVTMSELARLVLMNPPTLTKLIDRMVSENLVHRQISKQDHRQFNVVLTDMAHKRIAEIREQVQSEDARIEEVLGAENVALLNDMLFKIANV